MAKSRGLEEAIQASPNKFSPGQYGRWGLGFLVALGAMYALNAGHNLIQASIYHHKFKEQQADAVLKTIMLLSYSEGLSAHKMPAAQHRQLFDRRLEQYEREDKRAETLAQRDYHLTAARNPFYSNRK